MTTILTAGSVRSGWLNVADVLARRDAQSWSSGFDASDPCRLTWPPPVGDEDGVAERELLDLGGNADLYMRGDPCDDDNIY